MTHKIEIKDSLKPRVLAVRMAPLLLRYEDIDEFVAMLRRTIETLETIVADDQNRRPDVDSAIDLAIDSRLIDKEK